MSPGEPPREPSPPWVALGALALLVHGLLALAVRQPGYFDAWYYHHVATNLAHGRGLTEDLVWNYLDRSPAALSLPHPAHLYWMPLATWLDALGQALLGRWLGAFRAGQAPFALLSSSLPVLTAWLSWRLFGRRELALRAGLLALATGNYALHLVVPDAFAPFALAVTLALVATARARRGTPWAWLVAGLGAGLAHLARADGALVLVVVAGFALSHRAPALARLRGLALALAGYGALLGPWFARNTLVAGRALPGGGLGTLWLRTYEELFAYGLDLGPSHLASGGLGPVVAGRAYALAWDAVVVLTALQFVLAPFAWAGLRRAWRDDREGLLGPAAAYGALLFTVLPLGFSEPSRRGSLLHSTIALLPWLLAVAPAGVESASRRFARWRGEDPERAARAFGYGAVLVAAALTGQVVADSLLAPPRSLDALAPWNARFTHYPAVARWLDARGARGPVLVEWAPPWVGLTGRPALVIPTNGEAALLAVSDRFDARWLIVERDHPRALSRAWRDEVAPRGWALVPGTLRDEVGAPVRVFQRSP